MLKVIFIFFLCTTIYGQITVYKLNDLIFGNVFKGYTYTIDHISPNATKFLIDHSIRPRANLYISFVLPQYLTNGSSNVSISFSTSQSAWSKQDRTTGRTNFNPYQPLTIKKVKQNENVYIWMGATISPPLSVSPGSYSATIILSVEIL